MIKIKAFKAKKAKRCDKRRIFFAIVSKKQVSLLFASERKTLILKPAHHLTYSRVINSDD
jgi:hypothetical protein